MEIHLVSSLTSEDENRLAPTVMAAIARILDRLRVSYSVRIETSAGNAIQQHYAAPVRSTADGSHAATVEIPAPPPDHDAASHDSATGED